MTAVRSFGMVLGIALATACVLVVVGCERCGCGETSGEHVAELIAADGAVQRDFDDRRDQWEDVAVGAVFESGDGLRTGPGGSARVRLTRGGSLRLGENSFVRFLTSAPESTAPRMQIDLGAAEIRGGEHGVDLQTPVSLVRIEETGVLNVEFGDEGQARFEVMVGQASYITHDEEPQVLRPGRRYTINLRSGQIAEALRRAGEKVGEAARPEEPTPDGGVEIPGAFKVAVAGGPIKVRTPESKQWSPLDIGEGDLASGSSLQLGDRTSAELTGGAAQVKLFGAAEAAVGVGGATVRLSRGRAAASALGSPARVTFAGGAAVLNPHARASISVGRPGGAVIRVIRGEVRLTTGDEEEQTLSPGAVAVVGRDGTTAVERPPGRAAVTINAGTSASIHDPSSPTNLGIRFGDACSGTGLVEVPGEEGQPIVSQGSGRAVLRLPAGAYQYRLYCVVDGVTSESAAATGRVRILRDPGTTPFGVASHNTVIADGRRYTVMYQNVLPSITFRWPDAPSSSGYDVHFTASAGRSFSKRTTRPQVTLGSGVISAGSYTFQFSTSDGQRSPQSTLSLRHDAVMVVASIAEPNNGTVSPGQTVTVSGQAAPGSTVQVGGTTLPFDGQTRFGGSVTVPTDDDALAIRVTNPGAGVHIFLRHLRTSSR